MDDAPAKTFPDFYIQVKGISGEVAAQAAEDNLIKATPERLNMVADVAEVVGATFVQQILSMTSRPTSCTFEFGVNIKGEAGIPFITKGTAGAEFKVTIGWESKD